MRNNKMDLYFKLIFFPLFLFVPGKAVPGKGNILMGVYSANVPSKVVSIVPGKSTNISCFTDRPTTLQSCRWERLPSPNGKRYLIHVKKNFDGSNQDNSYCNCTYKYSGSGFDKGDCSISINTVSQFHFAKWECFLVGVDNSTWIGQLNITEATPATTTEYISASTTQSTSASMTEFTSTSIEYTSTNPIVKPYFKNPNVTNGLTFNETAPLSTDITCCIDAEDNNTSVKLDIQWEGRIIALLHEMVLEKENTLFLQEGHMCTLSKYNFNPDDNGKRLVCTAKFSQNSMEYNTTSFLPINITFGPMLSTFNNFTQNVSESNSLIIEVEFVANPQPNISWYLKYDPASGASFIIPDNHTKYKTNLHRTQNDSYSSTLEILNLEEEDYRREFQLVISNPFGTKTIPVHLLNPNSPDMESDTYWIIILTAVGTMIFLILVASVIFVVVRRKLKYHRGTYSPGIKAKYSIEDEIAEVSFR